MAPPKKGDKDKEKEKECDEVTLKDVLAELTAIKARLDKVDTLDKKIDQLQTQLSNIVSENTKLKEENKTLQEKVEKQENIISELRTGLDGVERHQRSWSVRVLNIPLTKDEERDPSLTMQKVYDLLLYPILVGAREEGALRQIPECEQLLETAHVLPGRPGAARPVIVRFNKRAYKSICFRFRRTYAPTTTIRGDKERQLYPFFDDLTRAAAAKMAEIQADSSVQACWSINGQLRFKMNNSDQVRRVRSVYDSLETILAFS